ncbi:C-C motif chemokine 20-like [Pelodytes ibericus]
MSGVCSLSLLCLLVLGSLCFISTTEGLFDCCYTYSKKAIPLKAIKGFVTQNSYEVCDINAVIFITRKFKVCANPKEEWVIKNIKALSKRRQKLSDNKISKKDIPGQ